MSLDASFDVVATRARRWRGAPGDLPYYNVIAGRQDIVAKKVACRSQFPPGAFAPRQRSGDGRVNRGAVRLPKTCIGQLTRVRNARRPRRGRSTLVGSQGPRRVAKATFEQLIGFQLTQDQLRYRRDP
jgi:hypothetical protein